MKQSNEPTREERFLYPNLIRHVQWPPSKDAVDPDTLSFVVRKEWDHYWRDYEAEIRARTDYYRYRDPASTVPYEEARYPWLAGGLARMKAARERHQRREKIKGVLPKVLHGFVPD